MCDTSKKMNRQKYKRQHAKLFSVLFGWLLGANFMIAVEEADTTTAFKHEEAAAKGKGIICLLCLRINGLNSNSIRSAAQNLSLDPWGSFESSLVHLSVCVSRRVHSPVKCNCSHCEQFHR